MNLKEEIKKSEIPHMHYPFPVIMSRRAEEIAEEYAKEQCIAFCEFFADTTNTTMLGSKDEISDDVKRQYKVWEENK